LKEDGTYSLSQIPEGKYRVEIFHPLCDKIIDEIEVSEGEVKEYNYTLSD
jgi:hypothetical protein